MNSLLVVVFHVALGLDLVDPEAIFDDFASASKQTFQLQNRKRTHQVGDVQNAAGMVSRRTWGLGQWLAIVANDADLSRRRFFLFVWLFAGFVVVFDVFFLRRFGRFVS